MGKRDHFALHDLFEKSVACNEAHKNHRIRGKTKICQNHEGSCTSGYWFRKPKSSYHQLSRKNTQTLELQGQTLEWGWRVNVKSPLPNSSRKFWFWHLFSCRVSLHNEAHTFRLVFFIKLKTFSKLVQHSGKSVKTQFPRVAFVNPQVRCVWN